MRLLILLAFLLPLLSCKKKVDELHLDHLEYRIVNNGDPNVSAFVIYTDITLPADGSHFGPSAAFNNIHPFDTVTLTIADVTKTNKNFLNARRSFDLRLAYRHKIFSPLYYSHNFIIDGEPYAIGWTYTQRFKTKSIDTVNSLNNKIVYINWPSDSAKLEEYW